MERGERVVQDKRYFPSTLEQSILIKYMSRYFSFPERSAQRNAVAEEVATILSSISDHWSQRYVRLWFNNNKNSQFIKKAERFHAAFGSSMDSPKPTNQLVPKKRPNSRFLKISVLSQSSLPPIADIDNYAPHITALFPNEKMPLKEIIIDIPSF